MYAIRKNIMIPFVSLRHTLIMVAVACTVLFLAFGQNIFATELFQEQAQKEKQLDIIRVKEGDTLWTLANAYYTEECHSVPEYIEEIKYANQISDTIYIGQTIIIPYYD